jgi:PAS domain S-box-containing protein
MEHEGLHEEAATRFAQNVAHVGSAVAQKLSLSDIVNVILDETVRILGAVVAYVYLASEGQRVLDLVGARNLPEDLSERLAEVSFDAPLLAARVASLRQAQTVSSFEEIGPALGLNAELASRIGCESFVSLPLVAHGHLMGVLTFALKRKHEFTADEYKALDNCAEIFSFGIANAVAYEDERRLRALFESVGNATAAIAGEFELQPLLQSIVDEARAVVDAEYAALGIAASPDQPFSPFVFSGVTKEQAARIGRHPRPVGTLGAVALSGRALRIRDVRQHPAFRGLPDHHPRITSFLGVPVRYQGRTVGNLYLANKRGAPEFSREDERAAELLASSAGAAVHKSTLREQLDFEQARQKAILENAPHGVHFVEAGTERVVANRRALEIAGQSIVPTLSGYRGQVCTADGKPLPVDEWPSRRVLRGEAFDTQEMILRTPDGREVPLLVSASPIFHREGRLEGVVVGYEDISILKELQRARERWAAVVAHDLRQPLNTITTSVDMLQQMGGSLDANRVFTALEQTRKAATTLNKMIGDLTDISRIETGHVVLEREATDVGVLVRDVVERHRATSQGRVIQVRIGVPDAKVYLDPVRIEQVLGNLLANAVKYSEPGTEIDVEIRREKTELRVSVTSRGPAIPAEEVERSFQSYFRTGMGLGLYIAKGLVEAHGGRIWVESARGVTTLQFALPV